MVNIPLVTMDDYGLLEPTDVGTMTIDYDPKEECKRRVTRWDPEEVVCMLTLIKEHNFVSRYSVNKMSSLLSQLMLKKGWNRTERQVHLKLTMLRKNFLACERQKLLTGVLKECPFYRELREIYRDANNSNGIDSEDYDTSSQEEFLVKFPSDPIDWSKGEVQKMLNLVKSMKLKNELTLTFFSPVAVKMIAEAMQNAGFDRSTEQVKNALMNLRTMYIDYKIGFDNNENPAECMFYSSLDLFWGREYKKCRLKEKKKSRSDDSWSTEETIVLLTLIQDLNIAEDAYINTEKAAEELRQSLAENGYCRSNQQIMSRLDQLKLEFVSVDQTNAESEAVQQFPFYNLYRKLFERQFSREMMNRINLSSDAEKDSLELMEFNNGNDKESSENHSKGLLWAKDEVKLLLKTVKELTSKNHSNESLEDEKLQRLVQVLDEAGFHKTGEQIKRKLTLLKNSYQRCNQEDSCEKDIFECPFYNELHDIFHTPVSDERYEFIQNLLTENCDMNTSKFPDHSYTSIKFGNSSSESRVNDKVTVIPNKCIDTWFPVESIIDEDGITASSTLDFGNLSAVSNKEQEQVIEDAILATLPNNNSDTKDENRTIPEGDNTFENKVITVVEECVPSIINDVALDQEVITSEENNVDYSKYFKYEDTDRPVYSATTPSVLSGEDEGPPPSKKLKITEDEKITGKNKFLLRPVEMNPSSLTGMANTTNTKFVRLIVANDLNKSRVNHITAHIEPININTASSVSSGMSSPVERADILKLAAEKVLTKEDFDIHKLENEAGAIGSKKDYQYNGVNGCSSSTKSGNFEEKISKTIQEAVQTMMKHDELMQQKHHAWMEKQFEIQRKHDENHKMILMNELKELRGVMTVLLTDKQLHANNQNR
ncbi:hypothetical protein TSAR_004256 [Trichomalopsis sarcophagae]|uniref:Myb/SANT-like DNA-binding domain-containing protein n=1 Tax=Trichomalopsis sarcophagae TaxID=543379 RepID=A0A232EHL0_9HYME|nr:hypothetical protein TSAR_004256 [Trichomalopsis sarcophagae]